MKLVTRGRLQQARAHKRAAARVTDLTDGSQRLQVGGDNLGDLDLTPAQEAAVSDAVSADRSGPLPEDPNLFVHVYNPPLRLLIVGAVHIDRKSVVSGKRVSVRVDLGGSRIIKKKTDGR